MRLVLHFATGVVLAFALSSWLLGHGTGWVALVAVAAVAHGLTFRAVARG